MATDAPPRPSLKSPRFSLHEANWGDVEWDLDACGHVVLDDVWSVRYLDALCSLARRAFDAAEARFGAGESASPSETATYLSGCTGFDGLPPPDVDRITRRWRIEALDAEFFSEFARSGLPSLYRHLLGGDFAVGRSERVVRRVDPRFPLRFAGLHCDGQLGSLSSQGLHSQRELTLWTPLVDCSADDVSRLLLLQRGEGFKDLFSDDEKLDAAGVPYLPIQLKPHHEPEGSADSDHQLALVHRHYERVFQNRHCYAPVVPLGSAILFDADIWHGSYLSPGMFRVRISMDFRAVGEYRIGAANRGFSSELFRRESLPRTSSVAGRLRDLIG